MAHRNVRILHVSIAAPAERVYDFVADPRTLPRWAPNFGHTITHDGAGWTMHTAEGPLPVRFAPHNVLGVLDHWVTLPGGSEIHNPMRVVPDGAGSVLTFTLFPQDGWSDAQLAEDAALVQADLDRLRALLESDRPSSSHQPVQTGEATDAASA